MRHRLLIALVVVVLLTLPRMAAAAGYDPARVPADAAWVAHLDVARLVESQLGQAMLQGARERGAERKLDAVGELLGVDLLKEVRAITLHAPSYQEQDVVAVVEMGAGVGNLPALAKLAQDYQRLTHRDREVHHWRDHGKEHYAGVLPDVAAKRTLLVIGQRRQAVEATMDLLLDQGPNVTQSPNPSLRKAPGADTLLFMAADQLDRVPARGRPARVLSQARNLRVMLGDGNERVRLSVEVDAGDAELAGRMFQIAQGALAMALVQGEDGPLARLVNAVKLQQRQQSVILEWSYPVEQLADLEALKARHGGGHGD